MRANLAGLLSDSAGSQPSQPALVHEGERIAYAALDERAARLATLLSARGVEPGDRVGIHLPNGPDFLAAYYGALRLGAIAVPLNALLRPREVRERLEHAGARVLVAQADVGAGTTVDPAVWTSSPPLVELAEVEPEDTAVILYTSGTTGEAKGAELSHAGLRAKAAFLAGPLLALRPDDVVLGAAPLAHVFGQSGVMNPAILAGACIALVPRFEASSVLELMTRTGTTVFLGVPTMCIALLRAAEAAAELPPLRVTHVGGASLAPETLREFACRFGCEVLEGYGMTETSGVVATHRLGMHCKPGAVGTPADGVEVRLVDASDADVPRGEIGEVLVRGEGLTRGYWRNPTATETAFRSGGWFATGDMGSLDEDGYLFLVDRKKDVILRGGYTVYPRELEDVLYGHPDVLEAVAVGVADELLGEEVVALVVPRPGHRLDPEEVREFVRERVAAFKYPRLVVAAERLPHSPSGKIQRREIDRAPLRRALDARGAAPAGAGGTGGRAR